MISPVNIIDVEFLTVYFEIKWIEIKYWSRVNKPLMESCYYRHDQNMTDWFYIHYSLKHYQAKCSGLSTFGIYVVIKQIGLYGSTQILIQFSLR